MTTWDIFVACWIIAIVLVICAVAYVGYEYYRLKQEYAHRKRRGPPLTASEVAAKWNKALDDAASRQKPE